MNSEELIQAFLQVIEEHSKIFVAFPEAIDDLSNLNEIIIQLENQTNKKIADAIQEWLYNYPSIDVFVRDVWQPPAVRKPSTKLSSSKSSSSIKDENIIRNRYPDLPKNLRKRISSTETTAQSNES